MCDIEMSVVKHVLEAYRLILAPVGTRLMHRHTSLSHLALQETNLGRLRSRRGGMGQLGTAIA